VKKNVLCEKGDEITRFDGNCQRRSKRDTVQVVLELTIIAGGLLKPALTMVVKLNRMVQKYSLGGFGSKVGKKSWYDNNNKNYKKLQNR
jgi:hypothetical protein